MIREREGKYHATTSLILKVDNRKKVSTALAETIAPLNNGFNENEGTCAAAFKPGDFKDGMLNLQLLTLDQYAPEAIEKIAVSDEFV